MLERFEDRFRRMGHFGSGIVIGKDSVSFTITMNLVKTIPLDFTKPIFLEFYKDTENSEQISAKPLTEKTFYSYTLSNQGIRGKHTQGKMRAVISFFR